MLILIHADTVKRSLCRPRGPQGEVMRTIAIVNQKGGCGKTTVAINLASCLAAQGKKTLLVVTQSYC